MQELYRLRELTDSITSNGYLKDQASEWGYAFDAIPDYIYIINVKSQLRFINKPLAKKLELDPERSFEDVCVDELLDFDLMKVCPGNDNLSEFKKSNVYIKKLNGFFNISRTPIYTDSYKLIGFICVLQPITKCNIIFEDVNRFLKPMLDAIPTGMCVVNMDNNKIVYVNEAFEKLVGYPSTKLINMDINSLFISERETKLLDNNTKVIEIPNSDHYLIILNQN